LGERSLQEKKGAHVQVHTREFKEIQKEGSLGIRTSYCGKTAFFFAKRKKYLWAGFLVHELQLQHPSPFSLRRTINKG
jgi:hypothetical protein